MRISYLCFTSLRDQYASGSFNQTRLTAPRYLRVRMWYFRLRLRVVGKTLPFCDGANPPELKWLERETRFRDQGWGGS